MARQVAHGLAVRSDRVDVGGRHAGSGQQLEHRGRIALAECGIEPHEPLRRDDVRRREIEHFAAQLAFERRLPVRHHLGGGRFGLHDAHERRIHGVRRGAGHEPDEQMRLARAVVAQPRQRVRRLAPRHFSDSGSGPVPMDRFEFMRGHPSRVRRGRIRPPAAVAVRHRRASSPA